MLKTHLCCVLIDVIERMRTQRTCDHVVRQSVDEQEVHETGKVVMKGDHHLRKTSITCA